MLLIMKKHGDKQALAINVRSVEIHNMDANWGGDSPDFVPHLCWHAVGKRFGMALKASWVRDRFSHVIMIDCENLTNFKEIWSALQ